MIDRSNHLAFSDIGSDLMPNVAAIERCMARGMKAAAAMDYVLGEGAYKAFAKEIYDSIRSKA